MSEIGYRLFAQVKAFIVGTARVIYTHKLLMLRALLIGMAAAIITGQLFVRSAGSSPGSTANIERLRY